MFQILLLIMGLGVAALLLWFIYPMLWLAHESLLNGQFIDESDPINAMSIGFGDDFFLVLGVSAFLAAGVLGLAIAIKRDPYD